MIYVFVLQLKFTLFEGGVRGVACIYSPLIESSSRVSDQLYHITDWLPTLYSAAGGDSNELKDLDGVDSWPAIKSAQNNSRETILLNIDEKNNNVAALKGYYKLVKGICRCSKILIILSLKCSKYHICYTSLKICSRSQQIVIFHFVTFYYSRKKI